MKYNNNYIGQNEFKANSIEWHKWEYFLVKKFTIHNKNSSLIIVHNPPKNKWFYYVTAAGNIRRNRNTVVNKLLVILFIHDKSGQLTIK